MVDRNYTTDTEAVTVTATTGGASADTIYTCPPNHDATVDFLHISNGTTSTQNVATEIRIVFLLNENFFLNSSLE